MEKQTTAQVSKHHVQLPLGPVFRHAYSPQHKVTLSCPELPYGRTKQAMKDECDINTIMRRYEQTGLIEHVQERTPAYLDCRGIDYQDALDTVIEAREMFDELPAKVRKHFDNDPAAFLDFVADPAKNHAEGVALGIWAPLEDSARPATPPAAEKPA